MLDKESPIAAEAGQSQNSDDLCGSLPKSPGKFGSASLVDLRLVFMSRASALATLVDTGELTVEQAWLALYGFKP